MSEITISIISHGDEGSIKRMLKASSDEYFKKKYEIIIRENKYSNSRVLNKLSNKYSNIKIFYNKKKYGFGKNHNLNYKEINPQSNWFVVCNPDLEKLPDKLNLKDYNFNKYNVISAKILNKEGKESDYIRSDISIFKIILRFIGFMDVGLSTKNSKNFWVPSVFKIFNRLTYDKLRGFDENIFMYYEDYDICMRAKKFCNLIIDEKIIISHEGRRSSRKSIKLFSSHLKSIIYVILKKIKGKYK